MQYNYGLGAGQRQNSRKSRTQKYKIQVPQGFDLKIVVFQAQIKHHKSSTAGHPDIESTPYKLYNKKYMIASTKNIDIEIFSFIAVLVFKLLGCKVLFINRKDNRNC